MADRAAWAKRVEAWRGSGQTAARFCEGREFSVGSLRSWSSHLGRLSRDETRPTIRMARVVRRSAISSDGIAIATSVGAIVVEIGGARVAVRAGFDRDTLAAVLDVLASRGLEVTR